MPGEVFRENDRLSLRTVEPEDDEFLQRNRNDPSIRWPNGAFEPKTAADVETYREEVVGGDDGVTLLACRGEKPVGMVFLYDEEPRHGLAELGCWIAPEEHGQGYATAANALLCDHAFRERALRKVTASAFAGNDQSIAVLDKLGFTEEGRHRRELFVEGSYRDIRRFGLFADEFEYLDEKFGRVGGE
jgi:RimJ/RimL family protein N-acetyltransferase